MNMEKYDHNRVQLAHKRASNEITLDRLLDEIFAYAEREHDFYLEILTRDNLYIGGNVFKCLFKTDEGKVYLHNVEHDRIPIRIEFHESIILRITVNEEQVLFHNEPAKFIIELIDGSKIGISIDELDALEAYYQDKENK